MFITTMIEETCDQPKISGIYLLVRTLVLTFNLDMTLKVVK